MPRILIVTIAFAMALTMPVQGQDRPWRGERHRDSAGRGPGFFLEKLLGDFSPEQKESLKALGKEFIEGARQYFPQMRAEVKALHEQVRAALSEEEQARVKGAFAKVHSLSLPEKLGIAQGVIRALNTPEMRSDIRLFIKGSPEDRAPAGDRIARAVAAKLVGEVASRAEIAEETANGVLKALGDFLDRTLTQRTAMRDLAEEKLRAAWAVLTPEQKGRIKGALRLVRGWHGAQAPQEPAAAGG